MMLVRAELCERLASLQTAARRLRPSEFAQSIASLKSLAAAYDLVAVVRVADGLERALAEDRGGCPRALYLGRLQDAIGCEARDEKSAEAMLASVSIRLCA